MSLKQQTINGVKWTGIASGFASLGKLVKIVVLNLYLGSTEFGLVSLLLTIIFYFLPLFDLGVSSAILHKQKISREEYSSLYWINILMGITLYILLYTLSPFVVKNFLTDPKLLEVYSLEQISGLLPLVGLIILLGAISSQHKTYMTKELRFRFLSITESIAELLSLGLASFLVMNNYGVYALIYSVILKESICTIVFFIKGNQLKPIQFFFKWELVRPFLKIGLPKFGSTLLIQNKKTIDNFVVGAFLGLDVLGFYHLAKEFASKPYEIINPIIVKVGEPILSKTHNDLKKLKSVFVKMIGIIIQIKLPIYIIMFLLAEEFTILLYDGKMEMVIFVKIFCIYMAFTSFLNPNGALYIATGRTDIELKWNIGVTIILTPIIFGASYFGAIPLAVCVTAFNVLLFFWTWKYIVGKLTSVKIKDLYSLFLIPFLYLFALGICGFYLKQSLSNFSEILRIVIISGALGVLYGVFLYRYNQTIQGLLESVILSKIRRLALRYKQI